MLCQDFCLDLECGHLSSFFTFAVAMTVLVFPLWYLSESTWIGPFSFSFCSLGSDSWDTLLVSACQSRLLQLRVRSQRQITLGLNPSSVIQIAELLWMSHAVFLLCLSFSSGRLWMAVMPISLGHGDDRRTLFALIIALWSLLLPRHSVESVGVIFDWK